MKIRLVRKTLRPGTLTNSEDTTLLREKCYQIEKNARGKSTTYVRMQYFALPMFWIDPRYDSSEEPIFLDPCVTLRVQSLTNGRACGAHHAGGFKLDRKRSKK